MLTTKKYIIKTAIKVIAFMIISTIALTLLQTPVITNEIALGQMENSDEWFLIMETYYKIVPIIRIVYGCVSAGFIITIIYDTYKFIKTKLKETTKDEND